MLGRRGHAEDAYIIMPGELDLYGHEHLSVKQVKGTFFVDIMHFSLVISIGLG